jgi:hypothetical protein
MFLFFVVEVVIKVHFILFADILFFDGIIEAFPCFFVECGLLLHFFTGLFLDNGWVIGCRFGMWGWVVGEELVL